jgi:hypothetical protein
MKWLWLSRLFIRRPPSRPPSKPKRSYPKLRIYRPGEAYRIRMIGIMRHPANRSAAFQSCEYTALSRSVIPGGEAGVERVTSIDSSRARPGIQTVRVMPSEGVDTDCVRNDASILVGLRFFGDFVPQPTRFAREPNVFSAQAGRAGVSFFYLMISFLTVLTVDVRKR